MIRFATNNESVVSQDDSLLLDAHPNGGRLGFLGWKRRWLRLPVRILNVGLLQAIADGNENLYTLTLWPTLPFGEGVRVALKAPAHPFRHNDPAHLSRVISRNGPGIVVVDSVCYGALCSVSEMVEVAEQHGCTILVDESHSLGNARLGRRAVCGAGLSDRVHFITASLAKAFAGRAGFFSVPAELRFYVLHHSYPKHFQLLPAAT